jgi:hypothetical protein
MWCSSCQVQFQTVACNRELCAKYEKEVELYVLSCSNVTLEGLELLCIMFDISSSLGFVRR